MSVVEQGTPVEVLTETEQRARTLEAAALEIEVRGWGQGSLNKGGQVCAAGAVGYATGVDFAGTLYGLDSYVALAKAWYGESFDTWGQARDRVNEIIDFNDVEGRTAEEVTFLMRNRAAELRSI